jgi:hypothetical protein
MESFIILNGYYKSNLKSHILNPSGTFRMEVVPGYYISLNQVFCFRPGYFKWVYPDKHNPDKIKSRGVHS